MKNKKLTYFLGLVVLSVWGLIICRVFYAVSGDEDNSSPPMIKTAKEPYNDYSLPKDTTRLLLNYRDPFGLTAVRDTSVRPVTLSHRQLTPVAPAMNWDFIKYSGYIRNPASKKLLAFVQINGKSETLSEGETKDQVKLIKNLRDSIRISFKGKTKFITIKPSVP